MQASYVQYTTIIYTAVMVDGKERMIARKGHTESRFESGCVYRAPIAVQQQGAADAEGCCWEF